MQDLLRLQISGGQTKMFCIGPISHASFGAGPVKSLFPKFNKAIKIAKY
jgi:hypothetical protein